ncbi:hypothetical protein CRE_30476 [Caenorhabditis remanei]|uniref:Reverse transcriptase domain-containing protein n=1 Tax=Caenorhabditis remanei TaxID=31234 RepID=E3NGJ2_CAERE|nr:hypothetical protein CRE_30476 [Caenorhabditis remanei]
MDVYQSKRTKLTRPKTRKTDLRICTFNCRSVATDNRLAELLEETNRIKYDIIGLSETKRSAKVHMTNRDGTGVILGKRNNSSVSGGVGFIINKSLMPKIKEIKIVNHRIGYITLQVNKNQCTIIQGYAPTAKYEEEEHSNFYENLEDVYKSCKSRYKMVIGDFNARIGERKGNEVFIGPHSMEKRNDSGERLATFCEVNRVFHMNSQFIKATHRRWTYISPDKQHRHELDHILANGKYITDVSVVPSFTNGSDHHQDIDKEYDTLVHVLKNAQDAAVTMPNNHSRNRLTDNTRILLAKRRCTDRSDPNFKTLSKECRQAVKKDHENFTKDRLLNAANQKRSLKKVARDINEYQSYIPCLISGETGEKLTSREKMEIEVRRFYSNLFATKKPNVSTTLSQQTEALPPFLPEEIQHSLNSFQNGKAAGEDKISADFLKSCHFTVHKLLAKRFSRYLKEGKVPTKWKSSKTTLIFKKGDKENLENYRPICLLPVLYKVFTKCILNRIRKSLEEAQPVEQAGFRRSFSTIDHIHSVQRLLEVGREYHIPITMVFIDFKKAFDTIEPTALWESLKTQGIDSVYIKLLKECYNDCSTTITPFYNPVNIPITRGVRQGDPISPNLFSACLESAFRRMSWPHLKEDKDDYDNSPGIRINGRNLTHLRFADDIILISKTPQIAEKMLQELVNSCETVGLEINASKTKVLRNKFASSHQIHIRKNNTMSAIEDVEEYVYLGRLLNTKNDLEPEIHRRRRSAWAALNNIKNTTNALTCPKIRAQLFDSIVLPALTYGSETWTFTKALSERVRITHAALERKLVGITLTEQREKNLHREDIRKMSQVKDPLAFITKRKLSWAGHVMRRNDNRWTTLLQEWIPRNEKRPVGRPPMRWADSLKKEISVRQGTQLIEPWSTIAKDRKKWIAVIRAHTN